MAEDEQAKGSAQSLRWDLFVSHASEDMATVVEPLVTELKSRGWRVWYDRAEITIGDRLRSKIDEGLAECRFGIVIVSEAFLSKPWPQEELDALFAREDNGKKVILPVWHGVRQSQLARFSPILAGRLAARWEDGIDQVVAEIERAMGDRRNAAPESSSVPLEVTSFFDLLKPAMDDIDHTLVSGPKLSTGYRELDDVLHDLARYRLLVVAGRPETGKTALALSIASAVALTKKSVGFIALRDSKHDMVLRTLAMMSYIDPARLYAGKISDTEYERLAMALGPACDMPLVLAESPNLDMEGVAATTRQMCADSSVHLLVVDGFDGIFRRDGGSVARNLYLLARELQVPLLVTAELRSQVRMRPQLTDIPDQMLADTADCVMLLHIRDFIPTDDGPSRSLSVDVAKNRLGDRRTIELRWDGWGTIRDYRKRNETSSE